MTQSLSKCPCRPTFVLNLNRVASESFLTDLLSGPQLALIMIQVAVALATRAGPWLGRGGLCRGPTGPWPAPAPPPLCQPTAGRWRAANAAAAHCTGRPVQVGISVTVFYRDQQEQERQSTTAWAGPGGRGGGSGFCYAGSSMRRLAPSTDHRRRPAESGTVNLTGAGPVLLPKIIVRRGPGCQLTVAAAR